MKRLEEFWIEGLLISSLLLLAAMCIVLAESNGARGVEIQPCVTVVE